LFGSSSSISFETVNDEVTGFSLRLPVAKGIVIEIWNNINTTTIEGKILFFNLQTRYKIG
jgi:hypothetical protein